ncbi:MAG TPA: response regulator [Brevundimonas sp.]|jgi:CheY-like chemotaxis protein|uniref:response regulator n=1 Tax=Brevundimonas sp. TaxID=1871086 RepID=UPI002ED94CAB
MASIVIVDDDPTVRLIATEMLRDCDHAIVEACDGDEALKLVRSMHIDLVVLDMLMPNKDGLETIIEIRNLRPSIRILAISSGGRTGADLLLRTAMAFGADATLAKPLRVDTFAGSVDRLLSIPARRMGAASTG